MTKISSFLAFIIVLSQIQCIPKKPSSCIGRTLFTISNAQWPEFHTSDTTDNRELVIHAWYPGSCKSSESASYIDQKLLAYYVADQLNDTILLERFQPAETIAWLDDEVSRDQKQFPVVLFSPGANTPVEIYTNIIREIVHNGYIVFAIAHTYDYAVAFPDGRFIEKDRGYFNSQFTQEVLDSWNLLQEELTKKGSLEHKRQLTSDLFKDFPGTINTRRRAGDITLLAEHLVMINNDGYGRFFERLDLKNIGAIGHSFGGAAAGQLCLEPAFLKAGINLDGWQFGDMIDRALQTPFLMVNAGAPDGKLSLNEVIFSGQSKYLSRVWIDSIQHSNFTDLPLFFGPAGLRGIGTGNVKKSFYRINQVILAYLDQYLKNGPDFQLSIENMKEIKVESPNN